MTGARLLPRDLEAERCRQLEEESIIYVCSEGRMHGYRSGKFGPLTLKDLPGLQLRQASKARRQRGFWGAYGDVPLISARRETGPRGRLAAYSLKEHPQHPFECFEILGHPVKRLYGHTGPLPHEIDNYAAMTEATALPDPKRSVDLQRHEYSESDHAPR